MRRLPRNVISSGPRFVYVHCGFLRFHGSSFPVGSFSARLFPIPSLEFEFTTFFGSGSCQGTGIADEFDLGCHGPFGPQGFLSITPVPAAAPYATPLAYNISEYATERGNCRRNDVKIRYTAIADGSCAPLAFTTFQRPGSLRLLPFPTPLPAPAAAQAAGLAAGTAVAIALGALLIGCGAGFTYAVKSGAILLCAKSSPAPSTVTVTNAHWAQAAKEWPSQPPPAFTPSAPPPLPNSTAPSLQSV